MKPLLVKCLVGAALLAAFAGFVDATYLAVNHYLGAEPPCTFKSGCEVVLTSQYAQVGQTPVALIGAVYYAFVILLLVAHIDSGRRRALAFAALLAVAGVLVSLWFVYLQIFVLSSYCAYCLVSAASSAFSCAFMCLAWHMQSGLRLGFTSWFFLSRVGSASK